MPPSTNKVMVSRTLIDNAQALLDHLKRYELDYTTQKLINALQDDLNAKYEAEKKRHLYTLSKTAPDKETRETARQLYCDAVGMHEDFRWAADGAADKDS